MPDIALYQPDIPQNTGTILRMAACLGVTVHLIEPAGFPISDSALKRAGMLAETGERIGLTGLTRPFSDRRAAERLADALAHLSKPVALPDTLSVKRFADVVLVSDFLDPLEDIAEWVARVASTGAKGHLVQVLDPIEETFPFDGRIEFTDPENGVRLTAGRAENWREDYHTKLEAHRAEIRDMNLAGRTKVSALPIA